MEQSENVCRKCKTIVARHAYKCPNCEAYFPTAGTRKKLLPFVVILLFLLISFEDSSGPSSAHASSPPLFSQDSKELVLVNPQLFKNESCFRIVGNIKNVGNNPWRQISVRANFYDEKQRLVDTNTYRTSLTLRPSESTPFKVVFGCCDKNCDMKLYQNYTLSIENAVHGDSKYCGL